MGNLLHSRMVKVKLSEMRLASRGFMGGMKSQFWMFCSLRSHVKWMRHTSLPAPCSEKLLSFQPYTLLLSSSRLSSLVFIQEGASALRDLEESSALMSLKDNLAQFKSSLICVESNRLT